MTQANSNFDTDHLQKDLGKRAAQGGLLMVAVQVVTYSSHIASTAVLARILTPEDYGLIAMAVVITIFAKHFRSLGLNTATIQRKSVTHKQISALFWINVSIGAGLAIIVAASAPVVAWFYGDERLVAITAALSLSLVINALGVQHSALIRRQMRFRISAARQISAAIIAPSIAITAALLGAGYWSLVYFVLSESLVMMITAFMFVRWKPGFVIRGAEVGSMLRFGAYVSTTNTASMISRNIDNILIGKLIGAATLGIYTKAYGLLLLPINQLHNPLSSVIVPALSRLQDDPVRFKRYYFKAITLVASLSLPLVGVFFVTADELVLTVLGSNWTEVTPLFRYLAPAALLTVLLFATGWAYISLGNVARQTRWVVVTSVIMIAAIAIGTNWGVTGVAVAVSIGRAVLFYPSLYVCYRGTSLSIREHHLALARPVISVVIACAAAYGVGLPIQDEPSYVVLIVRGLVFGAAYAATWLGIPGGVTTIRDLRLVLKSHPKTVEQASV